MNDTLSRVTIFDFPVDELRLWTPIDLDCIWKTLKTGLTGSAYLDDWSVRDIMERTIGWFPDLTCLYDCSNDREWRHRHTARVVEGVYEARRRDT